MLEKNHKWHYCTHCEAPVVLCGTCGNNCCNGGSGCSDCDSAYELQSSGNGCPSEFITRANRVHQIQKMSIETVRSELQKELTLIEVDALLDQYKHLTDE